MEDLLEATDTFLKEAVEDLRLISALFPVNLASRSACSKAAAASCRPRSASSPWTPGSGGWKYFSVMQGQENI